MGTIVTAIDPGQSVGVAQIEFYPDTKPRLIRTFHKMHADAVLWFRNGYGLPQNPESDGTGAFTSHLVVENFSGQGYSTREGLLTCRLAGYFHECGRYLYMKGDLSGLDLATSSQRIPRVHEAEGLGAHQRDEVSALAHALAYAVRIGVHK